VCSNLPFGERLGGENRLQLDGFYRTLGDRLSSTPGARVILLSAHERAAELLHMGKPRTTWGLWCGALKATLYRWDTERPASTTAPTDSASNDTGSHPTAPEETRA
jgi:23S rRNA G2445 N2-methylase RlmL